MAERRITGSVNDPGRPAPLHTKEFFVPVTTADSATASPYDALVGDFAVEVSVNTGTFEFVFFIPADFTTLTDAVMGMIPDATETVQIDVTTDFAAAGESSTTNSDSITDGQASATSGQILEMDMSAALTGLAASDYVGMEVVSNTSNIRILGLRIKYS